MDGPTQTRADVPWHEREGVSDELIVEVLGERAHRLECQHNVLYVSTAPDAEVLELTYLCHECGQTWSPNVDDGRLPRDWWLCSNGCNEWTRRRGR